MSPADEYAEAREDAVIVPLPPLPEPDPRAGDMDTAVAQAKAALANGGAR